MDGVFTKRKSAPYPIETSIGGTMTQILRLINPLLEERVQPHGITQGTWFFIRSLWDRDGVSQRELADNVGTSAPTAFAAVGALRAAGFITLKRDPDDRRRTLIHLTSRGRALEAVLIPAVAGINPQILRGFSRSDVKSMLQFLQRLKQNAQAASIKKVGANEGAEAA